MASVSAGETDPLENTPYRTIREIGRGAMGVVYEAAHRKLRRLVCVKVIHRELVTESTLIERMRLEAQALAALSHPNVVAVFDYGETPDGRPYIVTEILRGETLQAYLKRREALSLRECIALGGQLLEGLGAAHAAGLVHRDIKPANLFLVGEGDLMTLKILDFGVAKLTKPSEQMTSLSAPTAEGFILGTPRYMAPEQVASLPVDGRTDLYSAALVLYLMATGFGPYDDVRGFAELCEAQALRKPAPPSAIVASLPETFDALVLRALEKRSGDRFADAAEMHRALLAVPTGASLGDRVRPWATFATILIFTAAALFLAALAIARLTNFW